jgi:hypothetical protein
MSVFEVLHACVVIYYLVNSTSYHHNLSHPLAPHPQELSKKSTGLVHAQTVRGILIGSSREASLLDCQVKTRVDPGYKISVIRQVVIVDDHVLGAMTEVLQTSHKG